jgi:predicted metal-dependent phosphoesterase TrpH
VDAYVQAIPAAKKAGLSLIAGVEFSCILDEFPVHLLGYSFALNSPAIASLCGRHRHRRKDRNLEILKLLQKHRMPIDESELTKLAGADVGSVGRVHIARVMVAKGYVQTLQEAFNKYIAEGQPCFAVGGEISVQETIDCVKGAGGKIVIAHPHLVSDQKTMQKLLTMDFDGIEVYYGRFLNDQIERWAEVARQKNWMATGGSDFHGENRSYAFIGSSWIGEEIFAPLLELHKRNNPNM